MSRRSTVVVLVGAAFAAALLTFALSGRSSSPPAAPDRLAVMEAEESCVRCHGDTGDPSPGHDLSTMGCRSCHLGDASSDEESEAHRGMVRYPGDLDVVEQTCGVCHADTVRRVLASPMATGRGMLAVNRFAFDEQPTPDGHDTIAELGATPADAYFRQLCVACHLGFPRSESPRSAGRPLGGGCAACHSKPSRKGAHPELTLTVGDGACFGCHSGSSRISLSYAGWHETTSTPEEAEGRGPADADGRSHRVLPDDRVLEPQPPDLHYEAGLECMDCHTSREVMGDGVSYGHQEDAVEIACEDCHRDELARTASGPELDTESRAIIRQNQNLPREDQRFVLSGRGSALVNVVLGTDERVQVWEKRTGRRHDAIRPADACRAPMHDRLSCQTCHSGWAPQCVGCHIQREPDGVFREYEGAFLAEPPALGVRTDADRIVPVVPGMVMVLDDGEGQRHVRLYSPISPHTSQRAVRSCESCHRHPLALGYGRGQLVRTDGVGWELEPQFERLPDGLPADAWIDVLVESEARSTRTNLRPLSVDEQTRVLRVGTCLPCHEARVEPGLYEDFASALSRMDSAHPHGSPGEPASAPQ